MRDWLQAQASRWLQRGRVDLVNLWDFDVQLAVTQNDGIPLFEVTDLVTDWMNESFDRLLTQKGLVGDNSFASFDSIILLERNALRRRRLQGEIVEAKFKGAALFGREVDQTPVPADFVLEIQQQTLANRTGLLQALQQSKVQGLGDAVIDVRALLAESTTNNNSDNDNTLEVVIIVAIVVAIVAFLFLVVAIVWAWRYDRQNRNAYLSKPEAPKTGSDTTEDEPSPVKEVANAGYPESVLSESTYYRSGMPASMLLQNSMADAVSVSSMGSYGYSLDGYAPSLLMNKDSHKPLPTEPAPETLEDVNHSFADEWHQPVEDP